MDLFAYGSLNVIRYFSIINHTCVLFNFKNILNTLEMSRDDFKLMCCISGNDYLKNDKNIFHYYSLHKKFKKRKKNELWIDWLFNTKKIIDITKKEVANIIDLYTIKNELSNYKYFIIKNTRYNKEKILDLLKEERFIF